MNHLTGLTHVWGEAMWRASWQGGLAALAVWCICRLLPSIPARFQCWLWRLVILKFAVLLLWSVPIEVPLLPARQLATWESSASTTSIQTPEQVLSASVASYEPSTAIAPLWIVFLLWTIVVGCQAVRILLDYGIAHRLRRGCHLCNNQELRDALATASQSVGLSTLPALLETAGQGSPLLIGILRPAIVLPEATLNRLSTAERVMVIGHELAHLRRRDLLWSLVATVMRTVFFFHPLAWLSERRLRLTQEIAADELSIALQKQDPVRYATLLVSVVSKLGSDRRLPAMSVGAAGSQSSLKRRLFAMRFMKPVSRQSTITYGVLLGIAFCLGLVPWTVVAAQAPATDKIAAKQAAEKTPDKTPEKTPDKVPEKASQKQTTERGRFVSFKDGTLTLQANSGDLIVHRITESTKSQVWNHDEGKFKPAETADVLKRVEAGMWFVVRVSNDNITLHIGSRKGKSVGTFVSYKENRLLLLGKNLGESFTKKYGNNLHFNKFRDDVPIYESIDGAEYKLIGTANKVLGGVKEGTIITVHGEGDDNITLVQIGVPQSK